MKHNDDIWNCIGQHFTILWYSVPSKKTLVPLKSRTILAMMTNEYHENDWSAMRTNYGQVCLTNMADHGLYQALI